VVTGPIGIAGLAIGAFVGTNIDNVLALSAQLAASERSRHRRIIEGQVLATVLILTVAALGGLAFATIPTRIVGLLGLVPIGLGIRAGVLHLRRSPDDRSVPVAGGLISSLAVTLAIGADNVAVYVPVLASGSTASSALSLGLWILLEGGLVMAAAWLGRHPTTERSVERAGPMAMPMLYVIVGVAVLIQAGTLG
jgi:cadmium resistance protein CadD (predicted permease)